MDAVLGTKMARTADSSLQKFASPGNNSAEPDKNNNMVRNDNLKPSKTINNYNQIKLTTEKNSLSPIKLDDSDKSNENKLWKLGENISIEAYDESAPEEYICTNRVDVTVDCSSAAAYNKKSYVPYTTRSLKITNNNDFPIICTGMVDYEASTNDANFQSKILGGQTKSFGNFKDYQHPNAYTHPEVFCHFKYEGNKFIERIKISITGKQLRVISYGTQCLDNRSTKRAEYDCNTFENKF